MFSRLFFLILFAPAGLVSVLAIVWLRFRDYRPEARGFPVILCPAEKPKEQPGIINASSRE